MKYLILGGTGFIGRNLIKEIADKNNQFVIFSSCYPTSLNDEFLNRLSCENRLSYIVDNFNNPNLDFEKMLSGVDIIVHLISTTTPATGNLDMVTEINDNVIPTIRLLQAAVVKNVKKIVFISSGGTVYGKGFDEPISEEDKTLPICSYGIQKLTIEKYLALFLHLYGLKYNVIRLANPYGPLQNPQAKVGAVTTFAYNAINDLPITIFGDGSIVRDYIYIKDAVCAIHQIINYQGEETVFNVGSGKGHSLNDIVATINKILNTSLTINYQAGRNVDVMTNVLDVSKYENIFGNINQVSFEEGMKLMLEYFKELKTNTFA